jgi:hypothetical protein
MMPTDVTWTTMPYFPLVRPMMICRLVKIRAVKKQPDGMSGARAAGVRRLDHRTMQRCHSVSTRSTMALRSAGGHGSHSLTAGRCVAQTAAPCDLNKSVTS